MAKSHYSFKKRKKELARKLKQEQKRQRKLNKDSIEPEEALDTSEEALDTSEEALDASEETIDASEEEIKNPQT